MSGSPNITVTDINATNITATGTLTYEDVTNVDSLGIATARQGLNVVGGGLTVTGISTFFNGSNIVGGGLTVTGVSTFFNAAGIVGGGLTVTGISTFYTDYVNIGEVAIGASISAVGQAKFAGVVTSLGADTGILTARTDIHAGYYYESSDPGIGVTINSTTGITLDAGSNACQVINPLLINYAEKVNTIGNTGANRTIDIADGTYVTATLDQACTFAFTSPPSGKLYGFALQLTNGSGGAYSISWPGTVKWPGGSQPTRTTTDGKTDIWSFFTSDGGSSWYGAISLFNFS